MRIEKQVRGMRIIRGEEASLFSEILQTLQIDAMKNGFEEFILPCVEPQEVYSKKMGSEILNQMYTFKDKADRDICLRPEGTATMQLIAQSLPHEKDLKCFYTTKCWRYEKPQAGRYREFTQFGVEILNPTDMKRSYDEIIGLAFGLATRLEICYGIELFADENVQRGLGYYTENGFEITCPSLGAQKQVCGGGIYKEGCGFAFGIDRIVLAVLNERNKSK